MKLSLSLGGSSEKLVIPDPRKIDEELGFIIKLECIDPDFVKE